MGDVICPYCGKEQEINHDDGYGYEDGEDYEQECVECEKTFKFTTSILFCYSVCCESEEDHDYEQATTKGCEHIWSCTKCDHFESRK